MLLNLGRDKQVLWDDALIERSQNLRFEMNPPRDRRIVLRCEKPWERHRIMFTSAVDTGHGYIMYYQALSRDSAGRAIQNLCAAVSSDGETWTRPQLGLFAFEGSFENNIVAPFMDGAPSYNPGAPFDEPFLMVGTISGFFVEGATKPPSQMDDPTALLNARDEVYGLAPNEPCVLSSRDGFRWRRRTMEPLMDMCCDSASNQIFYDERLKKYTAFLRGFDGRRTVVRYATSDPLRAPWANRKSDSVPGGYGEYYISDELPVVQRVDERDQWPGDVQNPAVFRYPWARDAYIATPAMYRWYPGPRSEYLPHRHQYFNDGLNEIHLFVSRDGERFTRPSRRAYIGLEEWGRLGGGGIFSGTGLIRIGDTLAQYYTACRCTHGAVRLDDSNVSAICRADQRLDGFVCVEADENGGELLTRALRFEGERLLLNLDAGALGEAFVELQDENGRPYSGFAEADCDPIDRNRLAAEVTWRGNADLSGLRGKPVRMRVMMRQCKLYAFHFA